MLSGTPTDAGSFPITVTATNGVAPDAVKMFTIDIAPVGTDVAPDFTGTPPAATVGAVYNFAFSGITGSPAPTFAVDPATIAGGITISPDGVLSGTPTTSGSFPITVTATNGVAPDAVKTFTLVVNPAEVHHPHCPPWLKHRLEHGSWWRIFHEHHSPGFWRVARDCFKHTHCHHHGDWPWEHHDDGDSSDHHGDGGSSDHHGDGDSSDHHGDGGSSDHHGDGGFRSPRGLVGTRRGLIRAGEGTARPEPREGADRADPKSNGRNNRVRKLLRVTTLIGVSFAGIVVSAAPASAATSITAPSSNPFVVPKDAGGNPVPFTVSAAGFAATSNVFVEQCDGVAPTAVGWDPTTNCDLGSSPAAAIADGSGNVTFDTADVNHTLHPFKGSSPQGIFNCLSLNDPSPNNGLTDYRTCKIRVSTNNSAATADQVFLQLVLPDDPGTVVPPPARLAIAPANVLEGTSGRRALTFTATISRPTLLPVTFSYRTVAGTAKPATDFVAKTGQVTIPVGAMSAKIPIQVKGDAAAEPNEIFKVRLSNASGASIQSGLAKGTILNDDPPKPGLRVGIGNASVYEGNTGRRNLRFTVSLSDRSTKSVRVHYATTAGTATAVTDFIAKSANLTIPAGKTSALVTIPIVGDSTVEPNEAFAVKLTNPVRALIGRANATGNILKDD